MKLISFDIGIKNMAYCIFVIDASNQTLIVQDWGILNLMEPTTISTHICTCTLKPPNKKTTAKNCTHLAKYEKNGTYYCNTHAKKSKWLLPTKEFKKLKTMSKDDLIILGQKYKCFDNSPSTKKECLAHLENWFQQNSLIPVQEKKEKTAGNTDLITLGRNMTKCLNVLENTQNITHVIMENQISTIATRMKTVQGMLAQYYIMSTDHPHIEFISSANKLKNLVAKPDPIVSINANVNDKYKQHKKDSIEFCKRFLNMNHLTKPNGESWTSMMDLSKKDDLADCFLQGIWYLKQQKLINTADDLKIKCV
jgi:hypothetical protein